MAQKLTLLPPDLQLLVAWEHAIDSLIEAARDAAEFADGQPHGRSRSTSLRKLRDAVRAIDALASNNHGR